MIFICKYCGDIECECEDDLDDEEVEIEEDVCRLCFLTEECFYCESLFNDLTEFIFYFDDFFDWDECS